MTGHRLIHRDTYDECLTCAQTFDPGGRGLDELIPCHIGTTDPHVWTATAGGAECAYCRMHVSPMIPTIAIGADCITAPAPGT